MDSIDFERVLSIFGLQNVEEGFFWTKVFWLSLE
jgi:hypothetical protein